MLDMEELAVKGRSLRRPSSLLELAAQSIARHSSRSRREVMSLCR